MPRILAVTAELVINCASVNVPHVNKLNRHAANNANARVEQFLAAASTCAREVN